MNIEDVGRIRVEYTHETLDNRFDDDEFDDVEPGNSEADINGKPYPVSELAPIRVPEYFARDIFSQVQLDQITNLLVEGKMPLKIWVCYSHKIDDFLPVPERYVFSIYLVYNPRSGPPRGSLSPQDDKCIYFKDWTDTKDAIVPGGALYGHRLHHLQLKGI